MIATAILLLLANIPHFCAASEKVTLQRIESQPQQGLSSAVRVTDAELVHTTQLLPPSNSPTDAGGQSRAVLTKLDQLLAHYESRRSDVVKLNVYVRGAAERASFVEQLSPWSDKTPPAVAYVATPLPDPQALVALDAVFVSNDATAAKTVSLKHFDELEGATAQSHAAVLPQGDVIYISGQAEPGALAAATRKTLDGLLRTLKYLQLQQRDIVQIKCFLAPMSNAGAVNEQIAKFFNGAPIPPVVHVEWVSGSLPIEIELIAAAPASQTGETVSFSTPPWMKSSPVFSRIARIHGNDRIYVSGLYAKDAGNGEDQVRSLFASLQRILRAGDSDVKHLAKATYYVSDNDVGGQLNRLRPSVYDPRRPPAASKAMVKDVAATGRSITIDMIAAPASVTSTTFSMEVDFGQDRGQSFGSLFEVKNADGRVVAGAGFQDVYNTRFRTGRHDLQFFVRPDTGDDQFTIERLPHPDLDCGVYLFDYDSQVYAWTSAKNNSVRRWNEKTRQWVAELPPGLSAIRSGDGVIQLGNGQLVFSNDSASYNGRRILSKPEVGGYHNFYYADGHLFFYHRHSADKGAFTRLYACPWTPKNSGAIDLSAAIVLKTKYERETPFSWGQYGGQVLTVSNMGGIYVFEGGKWRTILAADNTYSYQVYSALHWHDRLLMAQYPTGNVFEYRGREANRLQDWPPVMPGVSPSARECQTLSIYRGDLLAGVWPWAELWRYKRNASQWQFMDRMFTHPKITDKQIHPYEAEAKRFRLVVNHWGQRITGMIPHGDALFLSTSSKGTSAWDEKYDFLSDKQRREYGAVLRLRMPGNLTAQIQWKDGPTRLEFEIQGDRLTIRQDGKEIAEAMLPDDFAVDLSQIKVNWSQGVFGPLAGNFLSGKVKR